MGLVRNTPLLTTIAEVVDLTGQQQIATLELDSEFAAADTLLAAHKWVYDRAAESHGETKVALLSNSERLERAVAFKFMELLVLGQYAADGELDRATYWAGMAIDEVERFRPIYTSTDDEPRAAEGIPVVGHMDRGYAYGGGHGPRRTDQYTTWKPGRTS